MNLKIIAGVAADVLHGILVVVVNFVIMNAMIN
jgi:hypothetical protein